MVLISVLHYFWSFLNHPVKIKIGYIHIIMNQNKTWSKQTKMLNQKLITFGPFVAHDKPFDDTHMYQTFLAKVLF